MPRAILLLSSAALFACSSGGAAPSHKVGDTCVTSNDCGALLCYNGASPGVCSLGCGGTLGCEEGSNCAPLITTLGNQLCLKSCVSNATCGVGYTCCEALGNVCAPAAKCTGVVPVNTGSTLVCASRTVVAGVGTFPTEEPLNCRKPVVNVSFTGAQVQVLGAIQVGHDVSFTVPPGTGTISILQQVVDGGAPDVFTLGGTVANAVVPFRLTGPDGGIYYDDDVQPNDDLSTMEVVFGAPLAATAAMTLPNSTQALSHQTGGYQPGTWTMRVNDFANECASNDPTTAGCSGGQNTQSYDIQIVTKPAVSNTGTVDLGLYLVSTSWTAASAMADANGSWTRFLDSLAGIYANAGICLGKVTFYDPPGWAKNAYAAKIPATDLNPCSLLDQMFTLSQPGGALPIFFVDDIKSSAGGGGVGVIVGIDGAIPGPAGAGGTVHSGALVNVSDLSTVGCGGTPVFGGGSCGADELAYIVAHEGGHFMGLYHTTEGDGTLFDPIGDTPRCAASCDISRNGFVTGTECNDDSSTSASCGGASDLMFWLLSQQARGVISPQQARIMRANPVVYQGSGQ